jgi:hypothetical protein
MPLDPHKARTVAVDLAPYDELQRERDLRAAAQDALMSIAGERQALIEDVAKWRKRTLRLAIALGVIGVIVAGCGLVMVGYLLGR